MPMNCCKKLNIWNLILYNCKLELGKNNIFLINWFKVRLSDLEWTLWSFQFANFSMASTPLIGLLGLILENIHFFVTFMLYSAYIMCLALFSLERERTLQPLVWQHFGQWERVECFLVLFMRWEQYSLGIVSVQSYFIYCLTAGAHQGTFSLIANFIVRIHITIKNVIFRLMLLLFMTFVIR